MQSMASLLSLERAKGGTVNFIKVTSLHLVQIVVVESLLGAKSIEVAVEEEVAFRRVHFLCCQQWKLFSVIKINKKKNNCLG